MPESSPPDVRKVCAVLVDRANYGRMKPVMTELQARDDIDLQVAASGTLVLNRFGSPLDIIRNDGFEIASETYVELEGSTPTSMAKSLGFSVIEFATEFKRMQPDLVLMIGDRYEALGAVLAAAYSNLCIAHIQGGEISGSIDESARHAITKFSHFHFPATERAADYLVRMGERPESILTIGCPSSDIARGLDLSLDPQVINGIGSGCEIDPDQPFLLVVFHPTTTEFGGATGQIRELLGALEQVAMPTLMLWPNIDAGSDEVSRQIRSFRTREHRDWLRVLINLTPEDYLRVLARAECAVGNSSSFVRDAGYFGTPVVLVGNRQDGRERDAHVINVPPKREQVADRIVAQLEHGRYAASTLYGDGHVAPRIAAAIATLEPYVQKRLHYPSADLVQVANAEVTRIPLDPAALERKR
jgi:UDP-hydrolysing UDP-N-acetyl-D-glucosamine 2-epimerase